MKNKISHIAIIVAVLLAAFTATALAAGAAAPDDGTWLDALRPVAEALVAGNYLAAAGLGLVAGVALTSKYGRRMWPFLGTGAGKAALVLVGSFGGAIATAALGGAAWSMALLWTALKVAFASAGGFSILKELLGAIAPHLPSWAQPAVKLVRSMFDRPDPVATAEAAGTAAVKVKPPTGAAGVVGKTRDLQ